MILLLKNQLLSLLISYISFNLRSNLINGSNDLQKQVICLEKQYNGLPRMYFSVSIPLQLYSLYSFSTMSVVIITLRHTILERIVFKRLIAVFGCQYSFKINSVYSFSTMLLVIITLRHIKFQKELFYKRLIAIYMQVSIFTVNGLYSFHTMYKLGAINFFFFFYFFFISFSPFF